MGNVGSKNKATWYDCHGLNDKSERLLSEGARLRLSEIIDCIGNGDVIAVDDVGIKRSRHFKGPIPLPRPPLNLMTINSYDKHKTATGDVIRFTDLSEDELNRLIEAHDSIYKNGPNCEALLEKCIERIVSSDKYRKYLRTAVTFPTLFTGLAAGLYPETVLPTLIPLAAATMIAWLPPVKSTIDWMIAGSARREFENAATRHCVAATLSACCRVRLAELSPV